MELNNIVILVALVGSQILALVAIISAAIIAGRKGQPNSSAREDRLEPTRVQFTPAPPEQPAGYEGIAMRPPGGLSPEAQANYEALMRANFEDEEEVVPPVNSLRPRNRYVEPD